MEHVCSIAYDAKLNEKRRSQERQSTHFAAYTLRDQPSKGERAQGEFEGHDEGASLPAEDGHAKWNRDRQGTERQEQCAPFHLIFRERKKRAHSKRIEARNGRD